MNIKTDLTDEDHTNGSRSGKYEGGGSERINARKAEGKKEDEKIEMKEGTGDGGEEEEQEEDEEEEDTMEEYLDDWNLRRKEYQKKVQDGEARGLLHSYC